MDRFETMLLYPDKTIENMGKNQVTGSLYIAAVKRVVCKYVIRGVVERIRACNFLITLFVHVFLKIFSTRLKIKSLVT